MFVCLFNPFLHIQWTVAQQQLTCHSLDTPNPLPVLTFFLHDPG